jgi:serine/threonine protein kinase
VVGVRQLGRFELLRVLGRGAQAQVWLAHDPRLDREVALKLLDASAGDEAVNEWLNEARAVSRLSHPSIVPVFEADAHAGQAYLVFEYVEGPTLSQAHPRGRALPAREAVDILLGVLDALAAAHEQGVVHRDLKPSNILLGRDGRPRVMDFGIAARVPQRLAGGAAASETGVADGRIVGTPGYISPEAARGAAPLPAMDVFAAGVMLGELLCGKALLHETDPYRAVERVQREDLVLPASAPVDQTLRGIVQRALSRDLAQRYDSARSMHTALAAWLKPEGVAEPTAGISNATLEFLLRRMRHKTDFPALSRSIARIQRVATSETESLKSLTDEILQDVALTNKLLRMVNTAHFTAVSGGGIATVSRAVALVGFAGIRNMALSVVLLEHMTDKVHAAQLKEEFLRSLMAGTLAEELTPLARESEEAFLGAMFQNLGRMLTECYLPEEAIQIRQAVLGREHAPDALRLREAAALRVLGLSLDDLGAGVAKAWGLPDTLQRALRPPEGTPPRSAERGLQRLRWLGRGANAMADALLGADGDAQTAALQAAAEAYAPALGLSAREIVSAVYASRTRLGELSQAMGLHLAPGVPARRLIEDTRPAPLDDSSAQTLALAPAPGARRQRLTHALDEIAGAVAAGAMRPGEVLQAVLGTMHRVLSFRRLVFCLRDPGSGRLQGRLGLGPGAHEMRTAFRIMPDERAVNDLFGWLCARGVDLLVSDASTVANRLPGWFRQHVNAPTFLLMPMMLKGAPMGLIYADRAEAGSIQLAPDELTLLRALRDEASAAFARGP